MTKEEDHLNRETNVELQSETVEMSRGENRQCPRKKGRKKRKQGRHHDGSLSSTELRPASQKRRHPRSDKLHRAQQTPLHRERPV